MLSYRTKIQNGSMQVKNRMKIATISLLYLLFKECSDLSKDIMKSLKWKEEYPPSRTETSDWPSKEDKKEDPNE
jgi:hypothetical protein